jgi:hypothetical protein
MEINPWAKNNPNPVVSNIVFLLFRRESANRATAKVTVVTTMKDIRATYKINGGISNTSLNQAMYPLNL